MKNSAAKLIRLVARVLSNMGSTLRIVFLRLKYPGLSIDSKSRIERGCKIVCVDGGKLQIRNSFISWGTHLFADEGGVIKINDSFIGRNCVITSKKKIEIKAGCAIAEMVVIRDQNHKIDFDKKEETLYNFDSETIEIEENVWIGAKATILKGVVIGERAIIAASAVVNKTVPPRELWGGVPAKMIRKG